MLLYLLYEKLLSSCLELALLYFFWAGGITEVIVMMLLLKMKKLFYCLEKLVFTYLLQEQFLL